MTKLQRVGLAFLIIGMQLVTVAVLMMMLTELPWGYAWYPGTFLAAFGGFVLVDD